jgi:hypothetical protein
VYLYLVQCQARSSLKQKRTRQYLVMSSFSAISLTLFFGTESSEVSGQVEALIKDRNYNVLVGRVYYVPQWR